MTACLSFMVASITVWLTIDTVLLCIGVLVGVLVFAFLSAMVTPSIDKGLKVGVVGLVVCLIVQWAILDTCSGYYYCGQGWTIAWCSNGCVVAYILLYIDVFLVMGAGKNSQDEYILCSLKLYIDIIYLLLLLLAIFGNK